MKKKSPPATKADIRSVKSDITAVKADIKTLEERMLRAIKETVKEALKDTKLHFDVKTEQLTHDFNGIFNDRTVDLTTARHDHERRIRVLENRAGVFS